MLVNNTHQHFSLNVPFIDLKKFSFFVIYCWLIVKYVSRESNSTYWFQDLRF